MMYGTQKIMECPNCNEAYLILQSACPACGVAPVPPAKVAPMIMSKSTCNLRVDGQVLRFVIPIHPIPKQSVRFGYRKGYTPKRIKSYEKKIEQVVQQFATQNFEDALLTVELWFYRENRIRTDCDNLAKPVMDAMEGILFDNDNQVMDLNIRKRFDKQNPRIEVAIALFEEDREQAA